MRLLTLGILASALLLFATLFSTREVSAHAELERSNPPADSVLAAPPTKIDLWLTEAVATGAGSPALSVLDEDGKALAITDLAVDPADSHHVSAKLDGVGFGTFTVVWSNRSEDDGHSLTGTYAFRVGGTDRAPGAATVAGEKPRAWAVAMRWLTFLGASIAASGFLFALLVATGAEDDRAARRRFGIAAGAAAIAIVATALEPVLQSQFPPSGTISPSLSDAIRGLPDVWFLRIPFLVLSLALAAAVFSRPSLRQIRPLLIAGGAFGLIALAGLALTSHASARESWRLPAELCVILHQWSVGLWAGGLLHLVVSKPFRRSGERQMPVQRFSFWALFLAVTGIATGTINAGLVLPSVSSLWESDYGKVLLFKVAVLVPVLALATYHRLTLKRAVERVAQALRLTLRVETALIAIVVLGGSTLALLSPESSAKGDLKIVDLAAELPAADGSASSGQYVRFQIGPADQGENEIAVAITASKPVDLNDEGVLEAAPPMTDVALVRVALTNLMQPVSPIEIDLTNDGTGWFRSGKLQLGLDGWWRAEVLVRRLGVEDVTVPFFVLFPDPNVHGESAVKVSESTPDAQATFQTGFNDLLSLNSVHFTERLGSGNGAIVFSDHITHDANGDQPAAMRIATSDSEVIRMNGFQWLRDAGGEWSKTDAPDVVPPSQWGTDYENATGFRLGVQEQVGGRTAQIVTFYVPSDRYASAWYAWWVDVETGHILQESMVSRGHYMVRVYDGFNSAPPIVAPTE